LAVGDWIENTLIPSFINPRQPYRGRDYEFIMNAVPLPIKLAMLVKCNKGIPELKLMEKMERLCRANA